MASSVHGTVPEWCSIKRHDQTTAEEQSSLLFLTTKVTRPASIESTVNAMMAMARRLCTIWVMFLVFIPSSHATTTYQRSLILNPRIRGLQRHTARTLQGKGGDPSDISVLGVGHDGKKHMPQGKLPESPDTTVAPTATDVSSDGNDDTTGPSSTPVPSTAPAPLSTPSPSVASTTMPSTSTMEEEEEQPRTRALLPFSLDFDGQLSIDDVDRGMYCIPSILS
jgi:hypothetical protein